MNVRITVITDAGKQMEREFKDVANFAAYTDGIKMQTLGGAFESFDYRDLVSLRVNDSCWRERK